MKEDKVEKSFKKLISSVSDLIEDFVSQTQSPIEKIFLLEFLQFVEGNGGFLVYCREERLFFEHGYKEKNDKGYEDLGGVMECIKNFYGENLLIIPQFKIAPFFTVDFLIYLPVLNLKVIVECDGHDFHEKTKEQAKKDKQRDRFLVMNGFYNFRFTGSEIYNNSFRAVMDIEDFIIQKLMKNHAQQEKEIKIKKEGQPKVNKSKKKVENKVGQRSIKGKKK